MASSPNQYPRVSNAYSKTLKFSAHNYKIKKEKINRKLAELEEDMRVNHSDYLKDTVEKVAKMLNIDKVDKIIQISETEPEFLTIFGETEDDVHNWRNVT